MHSSGHGVDKSKKSHFFDRARRPLTVYVILVLSGYSLISLFIALVSDNWLITREKLFEVNGTADYLETSSGLWIKCSHEIVRPNPTRNCSYINYFARTERDGLGPTESILLSLRKALVFPLSCFLTLLVGHTVAILTVVTFYRTNRKPHIFITIGTLHVIAGLFLFIGLIIYIGAITDEATDRSKVDLTVENPPFTFNYGPSLILVVSTFFSSELTGVLSIQFYFALKRKRKIENHKDVVDDSNLHSLESDMKFSNHVTPTSDHVTPTSDHMMLTMNSDETSSDVRIQMADKFYSKFSKSSSHESQTIKGLQSIEEEKSRSKSPGFGSCTNQTEVGKKKKKLTKPDRISERLSSPMLDIKMAYIQNRFLQLKRQNSLERQRRGEIVSKWSFPAKISPPTCQSNPQYKDCDQVVIPTSHTKQSSRHNNFHSAHSSETERSRKKNLQHDRDVLNRRSVAYKDEAVTAKNSGKIARVVSTTSGSTQCSSKTNPHSASMSPILTLRHHLFQKQYAENNSCQPGNGRLTVAINGVCQEVPQDSTRFSATTGWSNLEASAYLSVDQNQNSRTRHGNFKSKDTPV